MWVYHTCRAVGLTTWFNSTAPDFCAVIHHCDAVDSITPRLIDSSIFYYMFTCNNIIIECIHIVELRSALRINERDQNIYIQQQQGYQLYYYYTVKCRPAASTHFSGFESTGCKWMRANNKKRDALLLTSYIDSRSKRSNFFLCVFDWFSRESSCLRPYTHFDSSFCLCPVPSLIYVNLLKCLYLLFRLCCVFREGGGSISWWNAICWDDGITVPQ